jgi:hypothetical protein
MNQIENTLRMVASLSANERNILVEKLVSNTEKIITHKYLKATNILKGWNMSYPAMFKVYERFGKGAKVMNTIIAKANKDKSFFIEINQSKDFGKMNRELANIHIRVLIEEGFIKKLEGRKYMISPYMYIPDNAHLEYEKAMEKWNEDSI